MVNLKLIRTVRKLSAEEVTRREHVRDMALRSIRASQKLYDRMCRELESGYTEEP